MEIKIQIEKNLISEEVVGSLVSDQNNVDIILGEVISYDTITGIAVCELNDNIIKKDDDSSSFT